MGKSKSIQNQQKQNQEFQDYLDEIQQKLKEKAKDNEAKFEEEIKEHYGAEYGSLIHIATAEKFDFRQLNEVTLDNLAKVIQGTINAISPGDGQTKDIKEDAKKEVATIVDYKAMAAAVASNLIMAALNGLTTSSEITYSCDYKAESLCPGLTLHILVANDSYKSSRWFSNTEIVESYVKYQLMFSYQRAGTEVDIQYFSNQAVTIEKYQTALNILQAHYIEMLTDPLVHEEVVAIEKRINLMEAQITKARDAVQKIINEHKKNKVKAAIGMFWETRAAIPAPGG